MTQRRGKGQRPGGASGRRPGGAPPVTRRANAPRRRSSAASSLRTVGSKRDRLRAAAIARRRRARRLTILIGVPVAVVAVALAVTGIVIANQKPSVTVTGAFGRAPKVTIPTIKPPAKLTVTDLIQGHGGRVASGDLAVVNLLGYAWSGAKHKQVISSFSGGHPQGLTVGKTIPGLDKSLVGAKIGSRLLLSIPPKDGFGSAGNQQLGVTGTDTLVLVVDVLGGYPKTAAAHGQLRPAGVSNLPSVGQAAAGAAPPVTIPKTAPPGALQAETLIQGTGPQVAKGKLLVAQYEGLIWRNSKIFDSSWQRGSPAVFVIGAGSVIPGWDKTLVGARIGSRMLLVIPPKEGYGTKGNSQAGIKGTDTLVFVVDILAAY